MSEIDYGKAEQIVLEYAGGRGLPEDEMDWMDIVWKLWCELEGLRRALGTRTLSDEETLAEIARLEALKPEPESFEYRLLHILKKQINPPPLGVKVSEKIAAKERLGGG